MAREPIKPSGFMALSTLYIPCLNFNCTMVLCQVKELHKKMQKKKTAYAVVLSARGDLNPYGCPLDLSLAVANSATLAYLPNNITINTRGASTFI